MRGTHLAAAAGLALALASLAGAQDFRVETEVFVGKAKEPAARYLTVFKGPRVFDFQLQAPHEVTVYDIARGRFLLLDPQRRVQTEVLNDVLLRLTADLKVQALAANNKDIQFLGNPQFEVRFHEENRHIELFSKKLTYAAKGTTPKDPGVVRRYTLFADGYARVNGLRLGNLPPFARLQLNDHLAARGWIPLEVTRTIEAQGPLGKEKEVRTRHLFTERVLPDDEKKIGQAQRHIQSFENVTLPAYLQWPGAVAKAN